MTGFDESRDVRCVVFYEVTPVTEHERTRERGPRSSVHPIGDRGHSTRRVRCGQGDCYVGHVPAVRAGPPLEPRRRLWRCGVDGDALRMSGLDEARDVRCIVLKNMLSLTHRERAGIRGP